MYDYPMSIKYIKHLYVCEQYVCMIRWAERKLWKGGEERAGSEGGKRLKTKVSMLKQHV